MTAPRTRRTLPWQIQLTLDIGLSPATFFALNGRFGLSTIEVLLVAVGVGIIWSAIGLVMTRKLNAVALVVVVGVVVGALLTAITGSPQFAIAKDSFYTGLLGIAMLGSLALARPLMYYLVQPFATHDGDPEETAEWKASWTSPMFRHAMRMMTVVWGVGLLLDAGVRMTFVWWAPIDVSAALSPALTAVVLFSLMGWSGVYGRRSDAARSVAEGVHA